MDSDTRMHTHCFDQLASEYPQAAEQLEVLAKHLVVKRERLAALIRFCAAHPELPMMRMCAEYSAALDAVALEPQRQEVPEVSVEEAARLSPRERAARTKRIRTRTKVLTAAAAVLVSDRVIAFFDEVAERCDMSVPTLYNHFPNRNRLLVAAYEWLATND